MAAAVERPLGHLHGELGRLAERLGLALDAALLGDAVQLGLGPLDLRQRRDVLAGVQRALDQLAPDADQRSEQAKVVDLAGRSRARR